MTRNGTMVDKHYLGYFLRTSVLIVLFYINYLILIDKFLFKKQFLLYFAINIGLIIVLMSFQNFIFDILAGLTPPNIEELGERIHRTPPPSFKEMRIIGDYTLIVLSIGMSVALKATMRWHKDSINFESVKSAQLEADLRNLRSQLNPHFLFNTLNNIYSLIAIDSPKAQEAVHMLSRLLRYVLYENDQKFVSVDKEIEFTKNYIDLMRLRLNPNVKLNVLIRDEGCKNQIASLMFMTLIENAFKHGINNTDESFIDIKILVEENKGILCTVENSISESNEAMESKNSGIGLSNLKKRLDLLYPGKYQFETKKQDNAFTALLRINF
ncbi:GHKL domain-containing protein [Dysgonomonas sp. 216]|nr:GHKL domain-containing protein [Dysgonomonas sp. 216]